MFFYLRIENSQWDRKFIDFEDGREWVAHDLIGQKGQIGGSLDYVNKFAKLGFWI